MPLNTYGEDWSDGKGQLAPTLSAWVTAHLARKSHGLPVGRHSSFTHQRKLVHTGDTPAIF